MESMIDMELFEPLKSNQIDIEQEDIDRLILYIKKLEKWGNIHALTSVSARDIPYVFIVEPLMASMALSKIVTPKKCMDMGTGFGNPGIAMSVHFKSADFLLVDSSQKKTALLRQIVHDATFKNVQVLTSRLEDIEGKDSSFDLVVSRGIGPLERTLDYAAKFVKKDGIVATFKAKLEPSEFSSTKNSFLLFDKVMSLRIVYPSRELLRYLLIYHKVSN